MTRAARCEKGVRALNEVRRVVVVPEGGKPEEDRAS